MTRETSFTSPKKMLYRIWLYRASVDNYVASFQPITYVVCFIHGYCFYLRHYEARFILASKPYA